MWLAGCVCLLRGRMSQASPLPCEPSQGPGSSKPKSERGRRSPRVAVRTEVVGTGFPGCYLGRHPPAWRQLSHGSGEPKGIPLCAIPVGANGAQTGGGVGIWKRTQKQSFLCTCPGKYSLLPLEEPGVPVQVQTSESRGQSGTVLCMVQLAFWGLCF